MGDRTATVSPPPALLGLCGIDQPASNTSSGLGESTTGAGTWTNRRAK